MPQLRIRKAAQLVAAVGRAIFATSFGYCRSALLAALCINAENVFSLGVQAGFSPNMIEVGGADTVRRAPRSSLSSLSSLTLLILLAHLLSSSSPFTLSFLFSLSLSPVRP